MDTPDGPLFIDDGMNTPQPNLPFVERNSTTSVVYNPRTKKILGLKWKEVDWETLITGGVEEGQTPEGAARTEIQEETGYKNLRLLHELPPYHSKFFHHPKGVNRFAHFKCFLFELIDDEQEEISGDEEKKHEPLWLSRKECESFRFPEGHRFVFDQACKLID